MPKLTFRGSFIRYLDVRHEEAGLTTRLHMSANYTDRIAEAMGWPLNLPDNLDSAKLAGELILNNFVLTPNGGEELKQYEIDVTARDATKFEAVRVSDGEDSSHIELRFQIRSGSEGAPAYLSNYMAKIGKSAAALKVDCAKQEELDLQAGAEEENGETVTDDDGEVLLRGDAAAEHKSRQSKANGPSLASAREVGERSRPRTN